LIPQAHQPGAPAGGPGPFDGAPGAPLELLALLLLDQRLDNAARPSSRRFPRTPRPRRISGSSSLGGYGPEADADKVGSPRSPLQRLQPVVDRRGPATRSRRAPSPQGGDGRSLVIDGRAPGREGQLESFRRAGPNGIRPGNRSLLGLRGRTAPPPRGAPARRRACRGAGPREKRPSAAVRRKRSLGKRPSPRSTERLGGRDLEADGVPACSHGSRPGSQVRRSANRRRRRPPPNRGVI